MVEGERRKGCPVRKPPSVRLDGLPPPRTGEDVLVDFLGLTN